MRDMCGCPCKKDGFSTSIRQIFNGREQNDSHGLSCAWETRFFGRPKGVLTTETKRQNARQNDKLFRRVSAISRPASLFCILFSDKPEKSMSAKRYCASGAYEKSHPAQKNSPFLGLLLRAKLSTCGCGLFTNFLFTTAQQMFHKIACGQI